jgi:hypothetical protein
MLGAARAGRAVGSYVQTPGPGNARQRVCDPTNRAGVIVSKCNDAIYNDGPSLASSENVLARESQRAAWAFAVALGGGCSDLRRDSPSLLEQRPRPSSGRTLTACALAAHRARYRRGPAAGQDATESRDAEGRSAGSEIAENRCRFSGQGGTSGCRACRVSDFRQLRPEIAKRAREAAGAEAFRRNLDRARWSLRHALIDRG